jgi:molybdate transport system ATP-binding protein
MSLVLDARVAERDVDLHLEVPGGQTVAVLGHNGAGKSTLIGLLSGLVRPSSGRAVLNGRALFGPGEWLPPHRRPISLLAQDPLLFPHLSVLENVAFGLRSGGTRRAEARRIARARLDAVDASELAARRPQQLSGGQAQRVALARALATDPDLLLLDEPMAALDVTSAPRMRTLLRALTAERTTLLVTHDVLDAHVLADRVVVIDRGRIVEDGPTGQVLTQPRTAFTAELAGLNLLAGTGTGRAVVVGGTTLPVPAIGEVHLAFRPTSVTLAEASSAPHPAGLRRMVTDLERRGDLVRVRGEDLVADIEPAHAVAVGAEPGITLDFVIDPARVETYMR